MRLDLACGKTVVVDEIHQSRTYGGLLAGHPTRAMNVAIKENAKLDAMRVLGLEDDFPVVFVEPVEKIRGFERSPGDVTEYPELPGWITWVVLDEPSEAWLAVCGFTNTPGLTDEDFLTGIRTLDWKGKAREYCW